MILNQQTAVGRRAENAVNAKIQGHDIKIGLREFSEGVAWIAIKKSAGPGGKDLGQDLKKMERTLRNMRSTKNRLGQPCAARTLRRLCDYIGIDMPQYHF